MKVYESIVSDNILNHFPPHAAKTLMNFAANTSGIEEALAMATVFWPTIVEDDGHIFIADFYTQSLEQLKVQFHHDKRKIERWVNAWSLPQFFYRYHRFHADDLPSPSAIDDEALIRAFGEVLRFFWSLRLKTLFPDREFVIELGEGIEEESGLAITFSEKER
jgi:hypothetical protein